MGKKYVLVDDFDGKELPDDTQPVKVSLGRTTYNVYLSDDNYGKLQEALAPFITHAETTTASASPARRSSGAASSSDKERNAAVRHWAIGSGFKYENAKGEQVTLGERGRIPDAVVKAWEDAGSPSIG